MQQAIRKRYRLETGIDGEIMLVLKPSTAEAAELDRSLVWRGAASKTLNISKDSDKNYRNLEKARAKLFRN